VAVGGWNEGSTGFSNICRDPVLRGTFVNNMFNFVRKHNFNGVDIDWEFPAQRGGIAADKVTQKHLFVTSFGGFSPCCSKAIKPTLFTMKRGSL
jgi:GH18 family chitinase